MNDREKTYHEAMNQGHSAAWDQDWESAAKYYTAAIETKPNSVQAINNLGLAYFQLQRFNDAEACYKQANKLSPDDPLAIERLAQICERTGKLKEAAEHSMNAAEQYLRLKDVDKAIVNWQRVTLLIPEHLKAHSRLALVYERLGKTDQAVDEYLAVAALLQNIGQVSKAVQIVEKALKLSPENESALDAQELVRSNKTLPKPRRQHGATGPLRMAALREMEKESKPERTNVSKRGPDPIAEARQLALTDLAGLLFEVSLDDLDPESTQSGLRSMFGRSKNGELQDISRHLGNAIDLQTRAENAEAVKQLKGAIELGLDIAASNFNIGLLYHSLGQKERSNRHLLKAIRDEKFALASHLLIAQQHRSNNNLQKAAISYLEALREADIQIIELEHKASLRSQYEPLIEGFSQQRDTSILEQICDNVTEMLVRQNWRDHIAKTRKQMPGSGGSAPIPLAEILTEAKDSRIVEGLARINEIASKGYLRSAMEEAYMLLSIAPTYLPLHIQMAEFMLKMGNQDAAMQKFIVVSEAYGTRGEHKRATNLLSRVVELSPMDYKARHYLIQRLVETGDTEEAVHENIKLADVQYRLAQLDLARKTYESALRLAQKYNAGESWVIRILKQMADIDLQRLDWRQALRVFEQLRKLDPEEQSHRRQLVELNVRLGQNKQAEAELENFISYLSNKSQLDTATVFLEKFIEDNDSMAFARDKLAECYHQAGRPEEAIEQWDRVAEMMVVQGNLERAKEVIRAILLLDPPNADQYRVALQQLG
ncbi:MAG: tetratricopeptide repeat protein [Anaerolineales bacterium]|nr:tetratricopeptide repeat protein [Anaerolineales bacterium]